LRPILIANPRSDSTFVAVAEALMKDGVPTADALQQGLRRHFPRAVVRPRELSGEQVTVWYAYRDGHWTRNGGGRNDLVSNEQPRDGGAR
jgi:hypothetical protein